MGCRFAALILLIGIAGEALADAQLRNFRIDPAHQGRVCDVGLWRWSRHPNYFFEWFGWLAYPVIAISIEDPLYYPWGWASLLAPVFQLVSATADFQTKRGRRSCHQSPSGADLRRLWFATALLARLRTRIHITGQSNKIGSCQSGSERCGG
jgi:steroid 5-alpha reductase family enzyme